MKNLAHFFCKMQNPINSKEKQISTRKRIKCKNCNNNNEYNRKSNKRTRGKKIKTKNPKIIMDVLKKLYEESRLETFERKLKFNE